MLRVIDCTNPLAKSRDLTKDLLPEIIGEISSYIDLDESIDPLLVNKKWMKDILIFQLGLLSTLNCVTFKKSNTLSDLFKATFLLRAVQRKRIYPEVAILIADDTKIDPVREFVASSKIKSRPEMVETEDLKKYFKDLVEKEDLPLLGYTLRAFPELEDFTFNLFKNAVQNKNEKRVWILMLAGVINEEMLSSIIQHEASLRGPGSKSLKQKLIRYVPLEEKLLECLYESIRVDCSERSRFLFKKIKTLSKDEYQNCFNKASTADMISLVKKYEPKEECCAVC